MQDDAFQRLVEHDRTNWWFVAKQRLAADELNRYDVRGLILDIGCGTGGNALALREHGIASVVGFDASVLGLELARKRDDSLLLIGTIAESLPVRPCTADGIVSMDVIEHLDDDVLALRAYAAAVKPEAPIVIVVPAYDWAWSEKDVRLGHRRRYTKAKLRCALVDAGLQVERVTYFHSWLAAVALVMRKTPLRRLLSGGRDEAGNAGVRVNRILCGVGSLERAALRIIDLPFGLSLFAVARVPSSER